MAYKLTSSYALQLRALYQYQLDGQSGKVKRIPPSTMAAHVTTILAEWQKATDKVIRMPKPTQTDWSEIEFVTINLTEEQAKEFSVWAKKPPTPLGDMIGQVMVTGYKVSIGWDNSNQCFIATFTGRKEQKHNPARSLSSRSDDWYESLAINCYKHFVLSSAARWEGGKDKKNWG